MSPRFVFRVLRLDEEPSLGLFPKNPFSNESVARHVNQYNERDFRSSRYISTTASAETAIKWCIWNRRSQDNPAFSMIDTRFLDPTCIIDLTIEDIRNHYIPDVSDKITREFAQRSWEVLFTKPIPASAIDSTWTYMDLVNLSYSYTINIPRVVSFLESRMIEQVMGELHFDEINQI